MSQSLAAAKKRRAPNEPPKIETQTTNQSNNANNVQNNGLTLPQVIQTVDRRLIQLEKFMNETKNVKEEIATTVDGENEPPLLLKDVIDEFDKRYEMLAEEIMNLKNVVINLQSFTMEVNKTMIEERRQLLSQFSNLEENLSIPKSEVEIREPENIACPKSVNVYPDPRDYPILE